MLPVDAARRLADDVLFPAAPATDAAGIVPVALLDALAAAGMYGASGPAEAGGAQVDFPTLCAVIETLASGCLTTAFVWAQHIGVVRAVASSENAAVREWTAALCAGECRAGVAHGGAVPGPAAIQAHLDGDGWTFTGASPFVSGWERIDVVHTAARTDDGRLVWALLDARESPTLKVRRLDLMALNATNTVRMTLDEHPVPAERVTMIVPYREGPSPPELLRTHASFALGVADRCCRLLGPTPFDDELARIRVELDRLDPGTIQETRGAAGELALRAAAALMVTTGARSLLQGEYAQLLAREALFALAYALRPGSRAAVLRQLGAARDA